MKIIFDNDATVTDYEKFINTQAIPYLRNRYGLEIVDSNALEIEDIFNLPDHFSDIQVKKMIDSFWISFRFVQYTLLSRFRAGAAATINRFIRQRHDIEVHTSRAKTCEQSMVGALARVFTIGQYWLNGVFLRPSKFHFYRNDDEKFEGILAANPVLIFDDKPLLINRFADQGFYVLCVSGRHNQSVIDTPRIACIESFQEQHVYEKMSKLLGKTFLSCANRGAISDYFYRKLFCFRPIVNLFFEPIILNQQNIIQTDKSVIYASNHRSTLDPIILTAILKEPVHWVALKRFFTAEDSIFNNSKSPILCKITAWLFQKLAFFPIERKWENPKANNFNSIRDMTTFLRLGHKVGIFPEGTTRRPKDQDFGEFDPSFLALASKTGSCIQPITVMWINTNSHKRIAVNFGKAFAVDGRSRDMIMKQFLSCQEAMLEEIKTKIKDLE